MALTRVCQVAAFEGHGKYSWTTLYGVGPGSAFPATASQYQVPRVRACTHAVSTGRGCQRAVQAALYWAYTTLVTVGYGDISAHTDLEVSLAHCSVCVFVCACARVFARAAVANCSGGWGATGRSEPLQLRLL